MIEIPGTPFDRAMDDIVSAESVAELEWLGGEVQAAFAADARLEELEFVIVCKQRTLAGASRDAPDRPRV